ncbi:hypothetical protein [Sodalis-like endosymbiont of Proechinophthirus fluctus]|uniref:hypothetical protein n=1 Tax=Sodalis-like endosymbiont of Proechinophthirus fluctus TaxID=1462730 RepID=UPI001650C92E|nr:hypothetical protein [Sodalis-like endosymbiont of Proechinophthirus fluctus]
MLEQGLHDSILVVAKQRLTGIFPINVGFYGTLAAQLFLDFASDSPMIWSDDAISASAVDLRMAGWPRWCLLIFLFFVHIHHVEFAIFTL